MRATRVEWSKTYGSPRNDLGYSAVQTFDRGYIITGYTFPENSSFNDLSLLKTDAYGTLIWEKTFGGDLWDVGYSVEQTSDEGYIVAGFTHTKSIDESDIYLLKTDSRGNALWTKTIGGSEYDCAYSIQQTIDGGYIAGGYTKSYGAGESDFYLIKLDSRGEVLWTNTYGGSDWEEGKWVRQTKDGGYIMTGYTQSFGEGSRDAYVVKTDAAGNALWSKTYGGSDWDDGRWIEQTKDGGYIITGSTVSSGAGSWDVYLVKTDSEGNALWTNTYGGKDYDVGMSVQQTRDTGYIIAGITYSFGTGEGDGYLIKTDHEGVMLWSKTYGEPGADGIYSLRLTSEDWAILTGFSRTDTAGESDVWLIHTDPLSDNGHQ
ncbi:MAG: hypothetical protein JW881_17315 [Spirochaetales bacterium]|nr:hypothetical protein [Spirochaetales bacterium]